MIFTKKKKANKVAKEVRDFTKRHKIEVDEDCFINRIDFYTAIIKDIEELRKCQK